MKWAVRTCVQSPPISFDNNQEGDERGLAMNPFASTALVSVLVLVAVVLAVAGIAVVVSRNGIIDRLNSRLERRKALSVVIFGILSEIILGGGIMVAVDWQSNAIAQAQLEIAERENDPLLTLEEKEVEGDEALYTLSNEKGMASYVSLLVREEFTFLLTEPSASWT